MKQQQVLDMKLSIITITFNAENTIEATIKSVIEQEIPVYEYLFIDGGSRDKTNHIILSYKEKIESLGIKFFHLSEKDKGISDAFNKGIKHATGDFIGIINSGDKLLHKANTILQSHLKNHKCDIVYGNCIWVDEKNHLKYVKKPEGSLDRLYYDFVLIHSSTFVSKNAYAQYGLYDITYKLCMDKELLLRMYISGASFSYIDQELTIFTAGGVSDKNAVKTIREGIRLSNYYHRPKSYTYANAVKKIAKYKISALIKKTNLYRAIKEQ